MISPIPAAVKRPFIRSSSVKFNFSWAESKAAGSIPELAGLFAGSVPSVPPVPPQI